MLSRSEASLVVGEQPALSTPVGIVMLSHSEASLGALHLGRNRRIQPRNAIHVYMLTNVSRTLYVRVTNNLERRMYEHKHKLMSGFTRKYNLTILVFFEETSDILAALAREKQIKGWTREKKLALIEAGNPTWSDLSMDF
jgi:putative endonuclease